MKDERKTPGWMVGRLVFGAVVSANGGGGGLSAFADVRSTTRQRPLQTDKQPVGVTTKDGGIQSTISFISIGHRNFNFLNFQRLSN